MEQKQKRLNKIVDKAVAIQEVDVLEADSLGFSARVFVQASLPHRSPRKTQLKNGRWIRRNGNFALIIQQGSDIEGNDPGFPFGNIPRLILTYFATQAVQTKCREISLGDTLSHFMRAIGMYSNGRDIRRMKTQLNRLLSASISFRQEETDVYTAGMNRPIARKFFFWWDEKRPDQGTKNIGDVRKWPQVDPGKSLGPFTTPLLGFLIVLHGVSSQSRKHQFWMGLMHLCLEFGSHEEVDLPYFRNKVK